MIWIALPVVVVSFFARGYLARIIFARSNREIAMIFGFLCVAIFFRIIYTIISRYFYAHKDTKTPLFVSLFIIGLNIVLAYNLSQPDAFGIVGLAISQSLVAVVEVLILVLIMIKRDHHIFDSEFVQTVIRILAVTGFTAIATYLTVKQLPLYLPDQGLVLIAKLSIITLVAFSVHTVMSYVFKINEAKLVVNRLKRIIFRSVKV